MTLFFVTSIPIMAFSSNTFIVKYMYNATIATHLITTNSPGSITNG